MPVGLEQDNWKEPDCHGGLHLTRLTYETVPSEPSEAHTRERHLLSGRISFVNFVRPLAGRQPTLCETQGHTKAPKERVVAEAPIDAR